MILKKESITTRLGADRPTVQLTSRPTDKPTDQSTDLQTGFLNSVSEWRRMRCRPCIFQDYRKCSRNPKEIPFYFCSIPFLFQQPEPLHDGCMSCFNFFFYSCVGGSICRSVGLTGSLSVGHLIGPSVSLSVTFRFFGVNGCFNGFLLRCTSIGGLTLSGQKYKLAPRGDSNSIKRCRSNLYRASPASWFI